MLKKLFFACYYQARRVVGKIEKILVPYLQKLHVEDIKRHQNLPSRCQPYAKPGHYNLVLIGGIGDVVGILALTPELEKTYGKQLYFMAKPSHEVLLNMFGVKNYQILDFLQEPYPFLITLNKTDTPSKDHLFFTHYFFQPIPTFPEQHGSNFAISLKRLLGLPDDAPFTQPVWRPPLSPRLEALIQKAGGLEKIILMSPESQRKNANRWFNWWRKVSQQLHQKGFTVVCNAFQPQHQLPDSQDWKLSAEEVIALGLRCRAVISVRSGLCDVLNYRGSNLFVIDLHPHLPEIKKFFNLNTMFGRTDIHEYFNELAISPEAIVEQICATKLQQIPSNFDTIESN